MRLQEEPRHLTPIIILLLVSVAVRLPYFYVSVINWDESTFILMGQSLLNGHLPYVEFWDLKPPLVFLPFALFIWLFGDSIIGIRMGGMLLVFITGLFVYLTGNRLFGRSAGIYAGIISILYVSVASGGQSVMSETIAIVPLMAAAFLTTKNPIGPRDFFWIAFLLSLATLVRLNLAYTSLFVFMHLLFSAGFTRQSDGLRVILLFALGGVSPILLVSLPYFINGHDEIYIKTMVTAPLAYANAKGSLLENLLIYWQSEPSWHKAPLWLAALGGVGLLLVKKSKKIVDPLGAVYLLPAFFAGTLFSILMSGSVFGHYLIQVVPLVALPAGLFYAWLNSFGPRIVMVMLVMCLLYFPVQPVIRQYQAVADVLKRGQSVFDTDSGHALAEALRELNPEKSPIWLTTHHVVYWMTGIEPVRSPVIHPSNISRSYLLTILNDRPTTTLDALSEILDQEPLFIVKEQRVRFLRNHPEAKALLDEILEENYHEVTRIDNLRVYQLRRP